jgi:hypothetical protein
MRVLVRSLIAILAVAVGVASTGIPIVSPSPPAAVAQESCSPNNEDPSIAGSSSDSRCIAELMRTTRGRINPVCLDDRALISPGVEYGMTECRLGPGIQAEAVAQARAIMRFNAAGYAGDTSFSGVTPNIQWEVESPAGRPDILLYDRTSPVAPIQLIEVRNFGGAANANRRMIGYLAGFPKGPLDREVERFDLGNHSAGIYSDEFGNYSDEFSVVLQTCEEGASEREVRDYEAFPYPAAAGILLFDFLTRTTHCDGVGDPVIVPRGYHRLPPPGMDANQNDVDDFWEYIHREYPEWRPGWLPEWDPEVLPRVELQPGLEHVIVPTEVFMVIVAAVTACATTACLSAVAGRLVTGWGTLATAGAATVAAALALAVAAILVLIGVNVWGDPHLVTLDRLKYDLQSVGEFHVFEVPSEYVDVQARFVPVGSRVSVMSRVATEINDTTLEFEGSSLWVNGELASLPATGFLDLGDGAGITRANGQWLVLWPGYGDRLMMAVKGNRLGIHVPADSPPVRGLLGNANGSTSDDLAYRDGTVLTPPLSRDTLYTSYANSWRISQAESLFTYGQGESTATFTDLTFPKGIPTLASLDANDRSVAEVICWNAGVTDPIIWEACVLDVALTGDSEFAESALGVLTPIAALTDSYFHDFEDGTAPGWSVPLVSWAENNSTRFLGPFASSSNTLTFTDLPPHTQMMVSFDVHVMGGWDGDAGSDALRIVTSEGVEILPTSTFSNTTSTQSYPNSGSPARTGAMAEDDLGDYGGSGSATYRFEATLNRWQPTMTLTLTGSGLSVQEEQFWGVDNLEVQLVRLLPDRFQLSGSKAVPGGTGAGSGNLELPRSEDHYQFTIDSSTKGIYVDRGTCLSGQRFIVVDSNGDTVTDRNCNDFEQGLNPGEYTLVVLSTSGSSGAYTANLHVMLNDIQTEASPGGGSVNVATSTPGQNAFVSFDATAGDRVSLGLSGGNYGTYGLIVRVTAPSGALVWSDNNVSGSAFFDVTALPETGTYTISVNPKDSKTGSINVTLWDVPPNVVLTASVGGGSVNVATSTPGQNAFVSFDATAGDRVSLGLSGGNYGTYGLIVRVTAPSGALVWSDNNVSGSKTFGPSDLPENGPYTISIDPKESKTGSINVTLNPG